MTVTVHAHRIILPMANGPTVEGKCACGFTKTYSSSGDDDAIWGVSISDKRKRAGDAMRRKARSAAQAQTFYGALPAASTGLWSDG